MLKQYEDIVNIVLNFTWGISRLQGLSNRNSNLST